MLALRLTGWKSAPSLVEVPDPRPGPGQVVVRVGGAGACHSDLHLLHDVEPGLIPWTTPFTLGHENAGWVHEVGAGVTGVAVGDAVAVHGPWGCGACSRCQLTAENYCENPFAAPVLGGGGGLGLDGGMAELLLVPSARHLVPLPAGLQPATAAPLTDAALTPYHAIRRSQHKLGPDSTAVVIGAGGLGHLAVQILKATTAAVVVAADVRAQALQLAEEAGADATVDAAAATAAADLRGCTGGRGADVVLDFVGSDASLALAATVARTLGDLTIVGLGGGTLPVSATRMPYEVSVQSTYWGSRTELREVLALAARGLLHPHVTTYPLRQAEEVYAALARGEVTGRAVIVP